MPKNSFILPVLLLLVLFHSAAWAKPGRRSIEACDQAARRAALSENIPLEILYAITRAETGRAADGVLKPWPWTVNVQGKGYWFASEAEAKSFVFNVFKGGVRSFDVGCFQINYRWHGKSFASIDTMFDPDKNASYAARFLKQLYIEHGSWVSAAGAYHSRTPDLAQVYVARIQTILAGLSALPTAASLPRDSDPFTRGASPLFMVEQAHPRSRQSDLGSLVPGTGSTTAFIAFNQE